MKFKVDRNAPGHLKREQKRVEFMVETDALVKQEKMIDWLVDYVEDDNPREAIMDASQNEIDALMDAIVEASKPNPKGKENSENT